MPRFFFDLADGAILPDFRGTELADVAQARIHAVKIAGIQVSENPDLVWDGQEFRVRVFDEQRRHLSTVVVLAMDTPLMVQELADKQTVAIKGGGMS